MGGTPRSEHDAFLRAICESPRDNVPRLVFADWLEEHGQAERAQLIRTDIAMSLRDEWDAERVRWQEGLTPQVLPRKPWFAEAYPGAGSESSYSWGGPILLRRGFRWSATVWNRTPPVFWTDAPDLFARHPIEHLTFFDHDPHPEPLVQQPWFSQLTGLGWVDGSATGKILRPLLKAAPPGLAELELTSRAVNPDGMRALGASGLFRNLTRLELSGTGLRIIGATLDALAQHGSSCRLRSLKIKSDSLYREPAALAACLPPSLRVLDLSGTMININKGAWAFVEALAMPNLRSLDLSMTGMEDDSATALFTSPSLAGLKILFLRFSGSVTDKALQVLLDGSPLADGLDLLTIDCGASAKMRQAVKERMGDRVRF